MTKIDYERIQDEVITKYGVSLHETCPWGCRTRTHAHLGTHDVCKWKQANSVDSTFELFHEIGHCETSTKTLKRCEEEYYATCWAIDRMKEYGLNIPERILHIYQRYVLYEVAKGKRRGGKNYNVESLNLYTYAGYSKTIAEFKEEIEPAWQPYINNWI